MINVLSNYMDHKGKQTKVYKHENGMYQWQNSARNIGPVILPYMYGICCVPVFFYSQNRSQKYSFQIPSKKMVKWWIWNVRIGFDPENPPAARLAQLDKRRSAEREAPGSSPGRTNTQGL